MNALQDAKARIQAAKDRLNEPKQKIADMKGLVASTATMATNDAKIVSPESIRSAAIRLGNDELMMESLRKINNNERSWFFSRNPNLAGSFSKVPNLKTWTGWGTLNFQRQTVLRNLADLEEDFEKDDSNLLKILAANERWRSGLYAVFWGSGIGKTWTCNIFVCEAIYWAGKDMSINAKYPSASQIHNDMCGFREVKPEKLQPGNIVTFYNGGHTEIVTKVNDNKIYDDGFCSVGAGRGWLREFGKEKCDWGFTTTDSREVKNDSNRYHSI